MCSEISKEEECPLVMECYEEDLTPEQEEYYYGFEREIAEFRARYQAEIESLNATVIQQDEFLTVYQLPLKNDNESSNNTKIGTLRVKPTSNLLETTVTPSMLTTSPPLSSQQYPSGSAGTNNLINITNDPPTITDNTLLLNPSLITNTTPKPSVTLIPVVAKGNNATSTVLESSRTHSLKNNANNNRRSGQTHNNVVDLTEDNTSSRKNNRLTFPSLVVTARPYLKHMDITPAIIAEERCVLDGNVKQALNVPAGVFTEFLIQKGLISSQQTCAKHDRNLKLAVFYKKENYPNSGGYVWIGDCCPKKFVSVFYKSLFDDETLSPFVLLKLIYHWACQTSIHNITNWVKVTNEQVKTFFAYLRSICTSAIWEKSGLLGGPNKVIQVSLISLITTNTDTNTRKVRVEVLGILDPEKNYIRLRGVEPEEPDNLSRRTRYGRILHHLVEYVDKRSTILVDHTVDKKDLIKLGYLKVTQLSLSQPTSKIMDYLKTVLPRMFQNTLPLLTQPLIQQFLDELCWRERFGKTPARAYNHFLIHLSEQTRLYTVEGMRNMLKMIASNPFQNWRYSEWQRNNLGKKETETKENANTRVIITRTSSANAASTSRGTKRPSNSNNDEDCGIIKKVDSKSKSVVDTSSIGGDGLISLEYYYYGTLNSNVQAPNKGNPRYVEIPCCNGIYGRNMDFMRHIASHVLQDRSGYSTTDFICKYCYENFKTNDQLDQHIKSEHQKNRIGALCCLICMKVFHTRGLLILHMQQNHRELEMPYFCNICNFRSSECWQVVDHFYEKHKGCERVICPFCLRTVLLAANGKKLSNKLTFFINHVQRHKNVKHKKCIKCELKFLCTSYFRQHMRNDHVSFVNKPNVIRRMISLDDTMMSLPPSIINTKINNFPSYTSANINLQIPLSSLTKHKCIECSSILTNNQNHFRQKFSCLTCQYVTFCPGAMEHHDANFHKNSRSKKSPLVVKLGKTIFCPCGYRSRSGMEIAQHLARCRASETVYFSSRSLLSFSETQPTINIDLSSGSEESENDQTTQMSGTEIKSRLTALTARLTQNTGAQRKRTNTVKETSTSNEVRERWNNESDGDDDDDVMDLLLRPDVVMECEDDENVNDDIVVID